MAKTIAQAKKKREEEEYKVEKEAQKRLEKDD